jgi:hypothetical protein
LHHTPDVASKILTREQAVSRKAKAENFVDKVLGDKQRVQQIQRESVDDWARETGRTLTNPKNRSNPVAAKADLQDCIDQVYDVLNDAYAPESSREDLVSAVSQALDLLDPLTSDDGSDDDADSDDDTDDEDE